jgi:hypothetical protein
MRLLLSVALAIGFAHSAIAQGPRPAGLSAPLVAHSTIAAPHHSIPADSIPRSHWKEGALIGIGVGLVVGGLTGFLIHKATCDANCGYHFSPIGFAGSLAIAGIVGGLIGSTIHDSDQPPHQTSHDK